MNGTSKICYVDDQNAIEGQDKYQYFMDNCRNLTAEKDTKWFLVSNCDSKPDENLELVKRVSNYTDSMVQAMMLVSDLPPRALESDDNITRFASPFMISWITNTKGSAMKKYSFNQGENVTNSTA